MRVLLFFNELSCSTDLPRDRADAAMRQFVQVLTAVHRTRRDSALVLHVPLKELQLCSGYFIAEWSVRGENRDLWRRVLSMQSRAPFRSVLPPGAGEGVEYSQAGRIAEGIGAAHLMDGLTVSLALAPEWDTDWVCAQRVLMDGPEDRPRLVEQFIEVRHAATADHIEKHRAWVEGAGIGRFAHGTEIWTARADLYRHLIFHPRIEAMLAALPNEWVIPVARELHRIDQAVGDWDPAVRRLPIWRSHITPESATRKRLCVFEDLDGTARVFDLHGRFTPGPGRVYFRLDAGRRRAVVAHIGRKRGV